MDSLKLSLPIPIKYGTSTRYWIKEDVEVSDKISIDGSHKLESNNNNNNVNTSKRVRMGRMLTSDVTDVDGNWRFCRGMVTMTLGELLGTKECVEVIIEIVNNMKPSLPDWPRYSILDRWKNDLRKDDLIDAKDKLNKWYEAEVKEVDDLGGVHIHYKGWGTEFDDYLDPSNKIDRILPLHTETNDRSLWKEGDYVELRVSEPTRKAVWMKAIINKIDLLNERVQVNYNVEGKTQSLQKFGDKKVNLDDDSMKKSNKVDDEGSCWCDLMGEDICHRETHLKPKDFSEGFKNNNKNASTSSLDDSPITSYYGRNDYSGDNHQRGNPPVAGAVGLQNLGNTCFMNSILQCLSNTQLITEIFTSDRYKEQLNTDNPLGHGGKLAQVYAKLIKDIWTGVYSKVVPREFKTTIGEFQPQFAGYDQQDSQELMNFLLDGLHVSLY